MPTLGVTIGKFYPFHRGHHLLISEARSRVDHLVVLIGHRDGEVPPAAVGPLAGA